MIRVPEIDDEGPLTGADRSSHAACDVVGILLDVEDDDRRVS